MDNLEEVEREREKKKRLGRWDGGIKRGLRWEKQKSRIGVTLTELKAVVMR